MFSKKDQMRKACEKGDEGKVRRLLDARSSLLNTSLDENGWTSLHFASRKGQEKVVKMLLEGNAEIENKTNDGFTPLHYASQFGYEKVVEMLLEANAEIESKTNDGQTPLHCASWKGQEKVMKILLGGNANIDNKNKDGKTPLHFASEWGQETVVKILVGASANIDAKNKDGLKPGEFFRSWVSESKKQQIQKVLNEERDKRNKQQQQASGSSSSWAQRLIDIFEACKKGNVERTQQLLNECPSLLEESRYSNDNETLLYYASSQGHENVVKMLLEANADVNTKDNSGCTPLHCASTKGHEKVVELLLGANADVNAKTDDGRAPLEIASSENEVDIVNMLLKANADVNTKNNNGWTPLHCASRDGHERVVKVLLEANANINAKNSDNATPLYYASYYGNVKVVEMLLEVNADTSIEYKDGKKAGERFYDPDASTTSQIQEMLNIEREQMRDACEKGYALRAQQMLNKWPTLLEASLDANGRTPLHYASSSGQEKVVELLLELNADVNAKDNSGAAPLQLTSSGNEVNIVRMLLKANADVNTKKNSGWTPLHCASREGHERVVKVLLEANANVNAKDINNATPLYYASYYGNVKVVEMLLEASADISIKNKDGKKAGQCFYYPNSSTASQIQEMLKQEGYRRLMKEQGNVSTTSQIQETLNMEGKRRNKQQQQNDMKEACAQGDVGRAQQLLNECPSLLEASLDEDDRTPLLCASSFGKENVVEMLLEANANINAKNNVGGTALHYACKNGYEKLVKVLLEANANIDAKDNNGKLPEEGFFSWINESKKQQIQKMLNEERDRRNEQQQQVLTPSSSPMSLITKSSPSVPKTQTQEAERIGKIKCKYEGDAIRFSLKKTTTFEELIRMVEGEWGEGKGVKFRDEDGDWVKIRTNDDVVEVWNQTKMGIVSLEVFSTPSTNTGPPSSSSAPATSTPSTNTQPPSSSSSIVGGQNSGSTLRQDDVGKEDLNNSVPIRGIWDNPLLSFEEAVQKAEVPNLKIDYIYSCLDHFECVEDPPPGLTIDEACAVRFYTMETPFYGAFNSALRTRDRNESKPFFPFLQLLLLAMHKLPKAKGILFRGTKNLPSSVIDEYKRKATTKKCVFWGACSSTTTSVATLQDEMFCGKKGNRAKFVIQNCEVGVSVQELSAIGVEKEVLLPPCLRFKVEDFVDLGNGLLEFQLSYSAPRCEIIAIPPPQFLS